MPDIRVRIMLRARSRLPVRLARLWRVVRAAWGDYFILPCPRCGNEMYGFDGPRCRSAKGRLICPDCSRKETETS